MPLNDLTLGQILAIAIPLAVTVGFIWRGLPVVRRWSRFLDRVEGTEASPGFDAQPGLWDRLRGVEDHVSAMRQEQAALSVQVGGLPCSGGGHCGDYVALSSQVSALAAQVGAILTAVSQLLPNGGSTLRDAIARIEKDTARSVGREIPHSD